MSRVLTSALLDDTTTASDQVFVPPGRMATYSLVCDQLEDGIVELYESRNNRGSWQVAEDVSSGAAASVTTTDAADTELTGQVFNDTGADLWLEWRLRENEYEGSSLAGEVTVGVELVDRVVAEVRDPLLNKPLVTYSEQSVDVHVDANLEGVLNVTGAAGFGNNVTVAGDNTVSGDILVPNIATYADNAAALADGKAPGTLAIINSVLDIVVEA